MTALLIAVGALFAAVIGCSLLEPWSWPVATDDQTEDERAQLMETIAQSFF